MFFYNSTSRAGESGELDAAGDYKKLKDFPAGKFGYWSGIVSVGGRLFFYNSATRAGESGELNAAGDYKKLKDFPAGKFGCWSHIASDSGGRLFFYNRDTGAGALGELNPAGDYKSLKDYPPGQFGCWSHIASDSGSRLFFYDWDTGSASVGRLNPAGDFKKLKDFPPGQFGRWTHVVPDESGLLFFYRPSGDAASGELKASGDYSNLKDFPSGQFERWHKIVGAPAAQFVTPAVQAIFNPDQGDKTSCPFPSNVFTVRDADQNTGLTVDLPLPDAALRPSDNADISVINTLDGFNITPRISIPFTGELDLSTVNSRTVFLQKLGSTFHSEGPGADRVGINQVVWDEATTTLHVTANDVLDQHTRYALVVTTGVRDKNGSSIGCEAFEFFLHDMSFSQTSNPRLNDYRAELLDALAAVHASGLPARGVVVASVFTTRSVTTELEKIRDQIHAAPAPTVFDLNTFEFDSLTDITLRVQNNTAPEFQQPVSLMNLLRSTPGIGSVAFGTYKSPDYRNAQNVIPATKTKSGEPAPQGENDIVFDLYRPSGDPPSGGWPVAIVGHGATLHKNTGLPTPGPPVAIAAALAAQGIATIAINGPGNGFGPLSTLTVTRADGTTVTRLSGGRGKDSNGDNIIGPGEGASAAFFPIRDRDRVRQNAVDLIQLVRVIDTLPDLDGSRIYYAGHSFGTLYGAVFVAMESRVRAVVLNAPFPFLGSLLSPTLGRPNAGAALAARTPSLINSPGIDKIDGVTVGGSPANYFNENLPLRDVLPVTNTIAGAMAIQEVFDNTEWVQQSGASLAYAGLLRSNGTRILVQFAKGDISVPNPGSSMVIRAGGFEGTTTYYRNDLAEARNSELPNDPHNFVLQTLSSTTGGLAAGARGSIARAAQIQIAVFFRSDGQSIIDPDGYDTLFEVPIPLPLPETYSFIS